MKPHKLQRPQRPRVARPSVPVREVAPALAERVNSAVLGALGRLALRLATTH